MKRSKIRMLITLFVVIICCTTFNITAFASDGETVLKENASQEAEKTDSSPLTPDGNLTLVDDIDGQQSKDKEFITVVSKNGNYFYLVIDHAEDKENVYFLNLVDESDLLGLIEDDTPKQPQEPQVCSCKEQCEPGKLNTSCPICNMDMTKCLGQTPELSSDLQPPKRNSINNGMLLILITGGLLGGGVFYYLKFIKNKQQTKGKTDLNEYEFDEDEDNDEEYYENEEMEDSDDTL